MQTSQNWQKSYVYRRRSEIESEVEDMVLLKVSPWKGVIYFRKKGKFGTQFIGSFRVVARVGMVAY